MKNVMLAITLLLLPEVLPATTQLARERAAEVRSPARAGMTSVAPSPNVLKLGVKQPQKRLRVFDVRTYGASSEGSAEANTNAIRSAVVDLKVAGGGELLFPQALQTFDVAFDDLVTPRVILFPLPSNTTVVFAPGTRMRIVGALPQAFSGVFGVDREVVTSGGRVTNLQFLRLDMLDTISATDVPRPRYQNVRAIQLEPGSGPAGVGAPAASVENVMVDHCRFEGFANAVWIVQASEVRVDQTQRQVRDVTIRDCYSTGTTASFVTADGENIVIRGNTAVGAGAEGYDAVSVHCGLDIRIVGNDFSHFDNPASTVINIRNRSWSTGGADAGSRDVIVEGNRIHDCGNVAAISIAAVADNYQYGVSDVSIVGNAIARVRLGILAMRRLGAASRSPWERITVGQNRIHAYEQGIAIRNQPSARLTGFTFEGNEVSVAPRMQP